MTIPNETPIQNSYMSKEKALRDFGLAELDAKSVDTFNKLSVPNQIMYTFHLNLMLASYARQQKAAQKQSCELCEKVPPPGEEDYS